MESRDPSVVQRARLAPPASPMTGTADPLQVREMTGYAATPNLRRRRSTARGIADNQGCRGVATALALLCVSAIAAMSARNVSATPVPVTAETINGVLFAARLRRAAWLLICSGVSASALLS